MSKTKSEMLFESYLNRMGIQFDYEPVTGSRRPDYWLKDKVGKYEAVVDVTDLTWPKGLPDPAQAGGAVAFGFDSYTPIRKKIKKKTQQFGAALNLPCLMVLYDAGYVVGVDGDAVYGAMRGDITISVPTLAFPGSQQQPVEDEYAFFGKGGTMINPYTRKAQHTRFSGIAVLEEVFIEQYRSGYATEIAALNASIESSLPEGASLAEIFRLYGPGYEEITAKYQGNGVDLNRKVPRLRIYRNPDARLPWPDHLASDADEVWGPDEQGTRIVKFFDGLESGVVSAV